MNECLFFRSAQLPALADLLATVTNALDSILRTLSTAIMQCVAARVRGAGGAVAVLLNACFAMVFWSARYW